MSTCPAAKLSIAHFGQNAVCSDCYATGGFYQMPSVKNQQMARRAWIARSLSHDGGTEFVALMTDMIRQAVTVTGENIFRGHDSGDFYAPAYVAAWEQICRNLPDVRFWFPTRSHAVANLLPHLQTLGALPNVVLRPSALILDEAAPVVAGLSALPTLQGHSVCPATTGEPSCDANGCRNCWNPALQVAYVQH